MMGDNRRFGALSSSADPSKLAETVKGAITLIASLSVYFGYTQVSGDLSSIADQVGVAITLGMSFYGAIKTVYGLVQKVVVKMASK
jgi:hypothetical protein